MTGTKEFEGSPCFLLENFDLRTLVAAFKLECMKISITEMNMIFHCSISFFLSIPSDKDKDDFQTLEDSFVILRQLV